MWDTLYVVDRRSYLTSKAYFCLFWQNLVYSKVTFVCLTRALHFKCCCYFANLLCMKLVRRGRALKRQVWPNRRLDGGTIYIYLLHTLPWCNSSSESADLKRGLMSDHGRTKKRFSVSYQSIGIEEGIRIVDRGQRNILVPLQVLYLNSRTCMCNYALKMRWFIVIALVELKGVTLGSFWKNILWVNVMKKFQ